MSCRQRFVLWEGSPPPLTSLCTIWGCRDNCVVYRSETLRSFFFLTMQSFGRWVAPLLLSLTLFVSRKPFKEPRRNEDRNGTWGPLPSSHRPSYFLHPSSFHAHKISFFFSVCFNSPIFAIMTDVNRPAVPHIPALNDASVDMARSHRTGGLERIVVVTIHVSFVATGEKSWRNHRRNRFRRYSNLAALIVNDFQLIVLYVSKR